MWFHPLHPPWFLWVGPIWTYVFKGDGINIENIAIENGLFMSVHCWFYYYDKWWFSILIPYTHMYTDWWFGTCFIFPYIGSNHPNWLIFFRGVETTNQYIYIYAAQNLATWPSIRARRGQWLATWCFSLFGPTKIGKCVIWGSTLGWETIRFRRCSDINCWWNCRLRCLLTLSIT